jgi:acyl-[acyl-carrier-protein]-phospholipid O-acyltransferase / long-chain-fatty-acid--[acyl-carrier-protein] ligase
MIRWFGRLLLKLCFRVRVRGTLERHDRLLLVSNHQSLLDGVLLGAFLPVTPLWVLHTSIVKHWYVRLPMRFLPHLVVDTANPLAMKAVIEVLEAGTPVLIFPEGRVTVTGQMMKIYQGPAFVAARAGATVVPVHIDGAVYSVFSRMSGDFPRKWFPRITITLFPPRRISAPDVAGAKLRRALETEALRKIMQEATYEAHERTTLFPALLKAIALHGRRRRILEDVTGKEMTYGGLLKASLALGRLLSRITAAGEFTGIMLPNVAATAAVIYGMFATGRVPAMLNYTAGIDGLQSACRTAGIRTVVTSRAFLEKAKLGAIAEQLQGVRLVYLEDLRASFGLLDKLWLVGWALRFPRRVAAAVRPEDPAVVVFTSGSEGKPKGVVLSHGALAANVAQCRAVIEFAPSDRFLSALPLFHTFGFTVGIILPLQSGSRVFLYTSPLHYRVIPEVIYEHDCTVLFASSTFLGNYAKHANPFDFRSLRLVVAGAEKLSDDVRKLYADKFRIGILEGYGVTETSPVLSVNTPMAHKTGTVGELFPGLEYRLEPVEGIDEGGLLHVRGPNVMLGYLSEHEPGRIDPVASVFGAGWYNTGDLTTVDAAGYIRILGRKKRFAKVAGEMVSLELVERIAATASPHSIHAAVACQEAGRGESVVLFTEDRELRREPLQKAARAMGAPELALPRRIVAVPGMPYLGNGKKDYVTLNRMARELASHPLATA